MGQPITDSEEFIVEQDDNPITELPEIEAKDGETEVEGLEIEVVDDAPVEDQGRTPLPEAEVKALEKDTEEYTEAVQKRIDKLTKARHDERRRADAKERELQEMEKATRYYMSDAQQQRAAAKAQAERLAELETAAALQEYQEAFDEGDSERVAKAQQRMNDASVYKSKVSDYYGQEPVAQPVQQEYAQDYQQGRAPQLDEATQEWVDKNEWFRPAEQGGDQKMTAYAMGVHQEVVDDGIRQGSREYFKRIDAEMRERFPEKFPETKQRPSTVVAPAGRTPRGKKVVLSESEARLANRLGLTLQQYAAAVVAQGNK